MALTLFIEIKDDGTFGDIYPKKHVGWEKLINNVIAERKKERSNDGGKTNENSRKS